ncbi:MAG: hypothetical protein ACJATT_001113 [Myxococcota bacterium]|jgi:hypothetical protein
MASDLAPRTVGCFTYGADVRTLFLVAVLPSLAVAADVEVVHSGRVLDTNGVAIQGAPALGLVLYNDSTQSAPTNELHSELFGAT